MEAGDVTRLLIAFRGGDREALDRLVPLVYDDMKRIARAQMRRGRRGGALQTTALVNEAWLRLVEQTGVSWEHRGHFLSVCARAMRQIVISTARAESAEKRGGGEAPLPLDEERVADPRRADWLLLLDRALDRLEARDERLARVVECRYFAGLTEEETAEAVGTSVRSVQRDWARARAMLRRDLGEIAEDDGAR